jgi:hypothetical protein
VIGFDSSSISKIDIINGNIGISDKAIDLINYISQKLPLITDNKVSEGREAKDLIPIHNIQGNKFRLKDEELRKIKDVTDREKAFVLKEFGIDYLTNGSEYQISGTLIFDQQYFNDITKIFPQLTVTIKRLVYQYIIEKKEVIIDIRSKKILVDTQSWIEENNKDFTINYQN